MGLGNSVEESLVAPHLTQPLHTITVFGFPWVVWSVPAAALILLFAGLMTYQTRRYLRRKEMAQQRR